MIITWKKDVNGNFQIYNDHFEEDYFSLFIYRRDLVNVILMNESMND